MPAYAVVLDDIVKDDAKHDYTWLMHTPAHMRVDGQGADLTLRPPGASARGYVHTPMQTQRDGSARWSFKLPRAGRYHIWARVRARKSSPGGTNSFFLKIDDSSRKTWHLPADTKWRWTAYQPRNAAKATPFQLHPGQHTLALLTREPGTQVDQVVVARAGGDAAPPFDHTPVAFRAEAETGQLAPPMRAVQVPRRQRPRLALRLDAVAPIKVERDDYKDHQRLKATTRAVNPRFVAVMAPLRGDQPTPKVHGPAPSRSHKHPNTMATRRRSHSLDRRAARSPTFANRRQPVAGPQEFQWRPKCESRDTRPREPQPFDPTWP